MDVLITLIGAPELEEGTVWVRFQAVGIAPGVTMPVLYYRIAYQWGTTLAQKRTGIIQGARDARDAYAAAHGVSFPPVDQIELLGI